MHGRFKSMYTLALVDTSWAFEEHVHPKVGSQSAFSTKEQVWSDLVHILSTHRANSLIPMQHVCKKAKLCQNKPSYSLCLLSNLLNLHQQVKKYCKGNENTQRYVTSLCAKSQINIKNNQHESAGRYAHFTSKHADFSSTRLCSMVLGESCWNQP